MKTIILPLLMALILTGCASDTREMNRLHIGMTREQVVSQLGNPDDASAKGNQEFLIYFLSRHGQGKTQYDHYVLLVDGKVQSYGSRGDFDTTEQGKQRLELDVNQKKSP